MQKRLLVLAAGILQVPVIKKAKDMGIYVIAADGDANAVGLQYADKAVVVNITSEEDVLRVAREERIDGVIHPCSEVSMNVMGRLNEELGLSGITKLQAIRATNKHLMREAFERGNAPSPKSFCFEDANKAWKCFCKELPKDGILKPLEIVVHVGLQRYRKDSLRFSLLNYSIVLKRNHVIRVLCLSSLLKGLSSLWKSLLGMVK